CQTGIAVSAMSVPVYVARGGPVRNDTASAAHLSGLRTPSRLSVAAVADAPLETNRIQEPTLIGEVTLKTRSMFRKRSGRPRSEIRSAGLTRSASALRKRLRRASVSLPPIRAARLKTDEAPASPPVKK